MLFSLNKINPNFIAASDDIGNSITYGELIEFGNEFFSLIKRRSLIFIICDNSIGSLAGYAACLNNRVVPLLLNSNLDISLLINLFNIYKPSFIWKPDSVPNGLKNNEVFKKYGYTLFKTEYDKHELHPELSLLLTTSGSTGTPKLVRHSYNNIIESSHNVSQIFDLTEADRGLVILPMSYTMGLSVINSHLYVGGSILLSGRNLGDRELWEFMKSSNATNFTGVPFSYEFMDKIGFMKMELPHLRFLAQGGGKLNPRLFEAYGLFARDKNIKFVATYGQTEGTARMSYLPSEMTLLKIGSIGKGMPNGELGIINDCGTLIDKKEAEGELVYRGSNVTLGYAFNRRDLLKGDENYGYLETGDVAYRDEDGYYFIIGRKSRFVKIFGERISLDHLQQIINSNFNVDCICGGDDKKIKVFIENIELKENVTDFMIQKLHLRSSSFDIKDIMNVKRNDYGKIIFS